jgi:DNA modification methylase
MNKIVLGDCLDVMREMDETSIDCVVTDPPYGLGFMGKDWDHGIPGVEFWKEALRVLTPGGYLLAFGGTRTFHRLTCAIEDAGFEIRDCMMWLYGSGFPKSHDVSKAIDKAAGAKRELIGRNPNGRPNMVGKQTAVYSERTDANLSAPSTDAAKQWSGWGTALKPAWEPIIVARKPLEGTVAENVLKWGTGGMNIDESRIEGVKGVPASSRKVLNTHTVQMPNDAQDTKGWDANAGRWPANVILDEEAGAMLDGWSGITKSTASVRHNNPSLNVAMSGANLGHVSFGHADTGGASRFFYCPKTSKRERGEGNNHPTVKPISLLQYLIKLVCPPGGIVLDPFVGSGSTAVAAHNLGFRSIGIEKEPKYVEIAVARLAACEPLLMAASQ